MKLKFLLPVLFACLAFPILIILYSKNLRSSGNTDGIELTEDSSGEKIKKRYSGMQASMDHFFQSRAYPANDIPAGKYYAGFLEAQAMKNTHARAADPWTTIGPLNFGGRTLSLVFNPKNPNTMYAGTASGGLWRTYTGGVGAQGWHRVNLGFPAVSIPTVAIAPNDSNTIYIGTGEIYKYGIANIGYAVWPTRGFYGIGILKSTDGGATWSKSLDWTQTQMRGVLMIKINPLNSDVVYAGTTEGTYRSNDAGATWNLIHNAVMATDVIIHPVDTNIVMIACGDFQSPNYGIYRSNNSGSSWTKIGLLNGIPDFTGKVMLGICEGQPDNFYASIGYASTPQELYHSTDKGLTWMPKGQISYTYGWFAHDVAANPLDPNKIIVAGVEIFKYNASTDMLDKKSIWYKWYLTANPIGGDEGPPDYAHGDIHDIVFHPTDTNIVYFATDGGIFMSLTGGETFKAANGSFQTQQFYQGFSNSHQDPNFSLGGLQDNATAVYEGNLSWRRVIGGDGGYTIIHPKNDNLTFGSTQFSKHYYSPNRAQTFYLLDKIPYYVFNTNFITPFIMCANDTIIKSKLYVGKNIIFKSDDMGANWQNMGFLDNSKPALAMAVSEQNCEKLYVSSTPVYLGQNYAVIQAPPANIFRSDDGGVSWTKITGTLPDRFYNDIAIHPTADSIVYIAVGGYGTPHIYKTTNSGQTWTAMSNGLPDLPMTAVVIDPFNTDHIYAGNDVGIYFSDNGGQTWIDYSGGLPEAAIIYDLTISPVNKMLRATTHGNGVYEADLQSQPVRVKEIPVNILNLTVYPNPAKNFTTIAFTMDRAQEGTLRIFNMEGKLVNELRVNGNVGSNKVSISTEAWSKGQYLAEIIIGNKKQVLKFLKI